MSLLSCDTPRVNYKFVLQPVRHYNPVRENG